MFESYPYTNYQNLNLDWIIEQITKLTASMTNFIKASAIKWSDPPTWSSTRSYDANMLTIYNGMVYISIKPVPENVLITDTAYWIPLMEYQEPERIILTPQMFGAVGDGVTDDTLAFMTAIDYCKANNVPTLFLIGHYKINKSFIQVNHLKLEGIGEAIITDLYTGDDPLFVFFDHDNVIVNGGMKNIKIISNSGHTGSIIAACNYNQIHFKNMTLWYGGYGMTLLSVAPSSFKALIDDCSFNNQSLAGLFTETGESGEGWVSDVYLSNVLFSNCKYGIRIHNVSGLYCVNCDMIECTSGLFVSARTHAIEAVYFTNSLFDTSTDYNAQVNSSWGVPGVEYLETRSIFFTNCWFSNSQTKAGLRVCATDDLKIANCEFLFNKWWGAALSGNNRVSVVGCSFRGNSLNTHTGLKVEHTTGAIITSNNLGGTGTGAFSDYKSITAMEFKNCNKSIVSLNVANDNTVNDCDAADNTDVIIRTNIGIVDRY